MANRRDLKKDLNWLTHEVISDCLIYLELHPEQEEKPVADIISKMINERNLVLSKINLPTSQMDRKEVKKMYNETVHHLLDTTHNCFEELSKLTRK
jgi:hypothetical protein